MALRITSALTLVAFTLTAVGCSGASSSPGSSVVPQRVQTRATQSLTPNASTNPTKNIPISSSASSPNAFSGTFSISKFVSQGGKLFAVGTLSGTLTNSATNATQAVNQPGVQMPVTSVDPSCPILTLTLGPLHLDLLGLVVDLNQVVLTITAQQGPGNLLGNLLCAITNLLNGGAPLTSITNLLNRILSILNGL